MKEVVPVDEFDVRTYGKYIVIYDKGSGRIPEYGSVSQVRVDDVVSFYGDEGHQSLRVAKITGSKWTRKIVTAPTVYNEYVVTRAMTVDPESIRRILRLKPGEQHIRPLEDNEED